MSSVEVKNLARNPEAPVAGGDPMAGLDADMRHVLAVLAGLNPRPIAELKTAEALVQPTLGTALKRILRDGGGDGGVDMEFRLIPSAGGDLRARLYTPRTPPVGETRPVLLYFHGGGFVLGDAQEQDATPRALARRTGALVVSSNYRQAPAARFPAAHEDALIAWDWCLEHVASLGGDPRRMALVGEDSGANLAVNVALKLRDAAIRPRHLALITPMAAGSFELASHLENHAGLPLDTEIVKWCARKFCRRKEDMLDQRINLIGRADLDRLPPTTIILAQADPLRSEGIALADAMRRSGVWVDETLYDGVTHGFVGLAQIVNKAMFAESQIARNLTAALEG